MMKKMKKKKINLNLSFFNLSRVFLCLFLIFIPFQVNTLLFYENIYFSGFFNPYLNHFIYLKDIFLLLSLFFFFLSYLFEKRILNISFGDKRLFLILLLLFFFSSFSLFFTSNLENSMLYLARFLEFLCVYFLLINKIIEVKKILYIIIAVISCSAFVGIFQYLIQGSIGLQFLGEVIISEEVAGISKIRLSDSFILRPYSFFPHPNVFAGFLLFNIFIIYFLLQNLKGYEKILLYFLLFLSFLALLLTFSRTAFLAFFGAVVIYFTLSNLQINFKKLLLSFLIIFIVFSFFDLYSVFLSRADLLGTESTSERIELLRISKYMFFDNYFPVGIGDFTARMQEYTAANLMPWQYQPVHNIYLLILNEQGIVTLFLYFFLFYHLYKRLMIRRDIFNLILIAIGFAFLIIGLFDHYLISLYQGQLLLFLYFALFSLSQEKDFYIH